MAFVLAQTEKFKSTVKVQTKQANGVWKEESFTAIFKRTGEDERERLAALKPAEMLREVLLGWGEDMLNEHREPVPFTSENLDLFLNFTGAVRETHAQYWVDNTGSKDLLQKNLLR